MSYTKFGPDRFSRFDVYWIQTNKQTDTQTNKLNLYIDFFSLIFHFLFPLAHFKLYTGEVSNFLTSPNTRAGRSFLITSPLKWGGRGETYPTPFYHQGGGWFWTWVWRIGTLLKFIRFGEDILFLSVFWIINYQYK